MFDKKNCYKIWIITGSYTIELDGGEMQTIYYISDVNGHRISINKPFSDEEINRPRIAPKFDLQRNDNDGDKVAPEGRNLNLEKKVDRESTRTNQNAQKLRVTRPEETTTPRISGLAERPRVGKLPDRPKNIEFVDKSENENGAEEEDEEVEEVDEEKDE